MVGDGQVVSVDVLLPLEFQSWHGDLQKVYHRKAKPQVRYHVRPLYVKHAGAAKALVSGKSAQFVKTGPVTRFPNTVTKFRPSEFRNFLLSGEHGDGARPAAREGPLASLGDRP